ncbi:MAG: 2-octaprenyl-6-methoxyphenyl hydroxylase [Candidatus Methylumidiphilus alinenensis]|uniref:2-octaprenyl-6-methoxyphenyl hydroxylase n=1 Tax=Candidatus Methylumidiphilus alinenensis TaxID=2202197 RepID=A0A2W4TEZ0_9GAMM|nr:MAG: 2-octaprenyl-6-methoxyphenyl hydroxylase [Candidatus Methylumidiphilus alinenensis]
MNYDYDVLIVGGGLVGGSLALALADTALRIGVIEAVPEDKRIASSAGDRALALAWGSAQILGQVGVWQGAEKKAAPIRHIHVSDQGYFGKLRMSAEREGVPALGYVATARTLEEEVALRLSQSPVTMICPASVIGLKAGSEAVHVSLREGNESINLTARLLVAADGGNSTVRKLLEIGQSIRDYGQTAIVTEVNTGKSGDFTAYERFTPVGPLAFLPVAKKRYSVVWTQKADDAAELLAMPDSAFTDRLQSAFGYWLGKIALASRRQAFPLKLIRAERMADERVVLIGNAMHQLHPVAGQGLNLGLRDVAMLAEMLVARLAFGEDIGERTFLERYAQARQADLDRVIRFTDSTVRIFSTDFAPVALARNAGLLALDRFLPGKRLLAQYAMGLGNRIPRFG